ncbi:MAG: hypothetical protein ACREVG_15795, partial [Burkholderiales bacterium]
MKQNLAFLVCTWIIAGCSSLPAPFGDGDESRQVVELVGYTQKVAALQAEEQRRELNASNQLHSKDQGPYPRVRLALLLA